MAVRHVDDVVMASADYCRACLASVLQMAYPRGVQFDVAEQDDGDSDDQIKVEWLDLTISLLRTGQLQIQSKLKGLAWVCGSTEVVGKHQVPPYIGVSGVDVALLRGMVKGRAALCSDPNEISSPLPGCAARAELWIRAGWPLVFLRSWWGYLRGYPEVATAA